MKFNFENLKRRSEQISNETRPGMNTAKRIGSLFYDIVCEIEGVYKKTKKRNFIISYMAAIASVAALILSFMKSDDISVEGANLLGWIVGVLAILVTVLIGFQIYKAIEIEGVIDNKMNSLEKRMQDSLEDLADRIVEEKLNKKNQNNSSSLS